MNLCDACQKLPEKADKLPSNSTTEHLGPSKRVGDSSPHFPKKYMRICPTCGAKWGIVEVNSWDSKWLLVKDETAS